MTITFQFIPDIFEFLFVILLVLSNVFLIYGGRYLQKTRESYMHSDLFIKGGYIGIIWLVILLFFPGIIGYNLTADELQFLFSISLLQHLTDFIINTVVFCIFFGIIGFLNKSNYGYFLLSAGLLFFLRALFSFVNNIIIFSADSRVTIITGYFFQFFSISAMVVFLIYSILIKERFLTASGICMIGAYFTTTFLIYYLVLII